MVKQFTWLLSIVLILIGVVGFFTNGTLLVFHVDPVHNTIHLLSGLVGLLAVGAGESYARLYLILFGIVYAVVTVVGFTMGGNILGLFMTNTADDYLHAVIALGCLGVGFAGKK